MGSKAGNGKMRPDQLRLEQRVKEEKGQNPLFLNAVLGDSHRLQCSILLERNSKKR